jgi:hypothetical protein
MRVRARGRSTSPRISATGACIRSRPRSTRLIASIAVKGLPVDIVTKTESRSSIRPEAFSAYPSMKSRIRLPARLTRIAASMNVPRFDLIAQRGADAFEPRRVQSLAC